VRDNDAQKGFSKLRSAIAALYAWRHRTTTDPALKVRYAREADFAFRQALAFGPINGEVAYKYVNLLNTLGRFEDARRVAQTLDAMDPNSNSGQRLLYTIFAIQEHTLKLQFDFTNAAQKALEISKLEKLDPNLKFQALARHTNYNQLAIHYQHPITSFHEKPDSLPRFNRVIRTYSELRKTNDLAQAIELFSKSSIPNRSNLTAIQKAYGLTGNWEAKLKTDQRIIDLDPESYIAWLDLALSHLRLQQTNQSTKALAKSLQLFGPAKSKPLDVMNLVRTNALFAPLREQPEIKKILERD
jgi:tetratricopeptide (TPR) repeat protein